jgi:predicted transcriptional regulator
MQINLTEAQSAQLTQIAAVAGRDAHQMAHDAMNSYLEYEADYIAGVLEAEASIARGEFYTHEEVRTMFSRFLER